MKPTVPLVPSLALCLASAGPVPFHPTPAHPTPAHPSPAAPAAGALALSQTPAILGPGDDFTLALDGGTPGEMAVIALSTDPTPTTYPFAGLLQVGPGGLNVYLLGGFPASGHVELFCPTDCPLVGQFPFYAQGVSFRFAGGIVLSDKSNPLTIDVDTTFIQDCNGNGVDDDCELEMGGPDCNGNGVLDECDILNGTSSDCDSDGVPDECQPDDNCNGIADACEPDCNGNGVLDELDIIFGTSLDCNANGVPDECDILSGTSADTNADGVPDECECVAPIEADDPGRWQLRNNRGGGLSAPPPYGLRLDGLFGDYPNLYSFDLEFPGTAVYLDYDGRTIRIHGTTYGGLDIGTSYDPLVQGYLDVDITYQTVLVQNGGQRLLVPDGAASAGSVTWKNTGQVIPIFGLSNGTRILQFDVDPAGQRLNGWLQYQGGSPGCCLDWTAGGAVGVDTCGMGPAPVVDCNGNGVPDLCDIMNGTSQDCDGDGVPDECELDCDGDGIPNDCDATPGTAEKYCVLNFVIDDPACSTTSLGTDVGMLLEDGFGWSEEYSFKAGAVFSEFPDGTATLTGEIFNRDNPTYGFLVDVSLGGRVDPGDPNHPPAGSPYFGYGPLKNCPQYLLQNGGPIDPSTWRYYETIAGTLTGVGQWAGGTATLTRQGGAFQVGRAANTNNLRFGAGAWFFVTYVTQPTTGASLPTNPDLNGELFSELLDCVVDECDVPAAPGK